MFSRFPWPATAAALVAFAALYLTGSRTPLLPLLGLALLGSYFTDFRFQKPPWGLRAASLALYTSVLAANVGKFSAGAGWILEPGAIHTLGLLCAVEVVVEYWRPSLVPEGAGLETLIPSGLVLMAACCTLQARPISILAPLYLLLVILSLRQFAPAAGEGSRLKNRPLLAGGEARPRHWPTLALGAAVLAIMLLSGSEVSSLVGGQRGSLRQWGERLLGGDATLETSGISTTPTLGTSFDVQLSPARVLRVEGPCPENHLRGAPFDTYVQGKWSPAVETRGLALISSSRLHSEAAGSRSLFTRLGDGSSILFTPLHCAGLAPMDGRQLHWDPGRGGPLQDSGSLAGSYVYTVINPAESNFQGPLCTPPSPRERERCLRVPPEIDPRVGRLAVKIGGQFSNPVRRVEAVTEYLRTQYSYSLTTNPGSGDPVSNFILQRKPAYCQYFASAAVMMLRRLGVPSRYVQGYYAHETSGPGVTVVRQRDAHAWVESWISGKGWITVDATPGSGRPDRLNPSLPRWLKCWEWLQDHFQAGKQRLAGLGRTGKGGILAGCVLVLLFIFNRGRGRRAVPGFPLAHSAPPEELASLADRFEKFLEQKGAPCPANCTWREHLDSIASSLSEGQRATFVLGCSTASTTPIPPSPRSHSRAFSINLELGQAFVEEYNQARFGDVGDQRNMERLARLLAEMEP